MRIQRLVTLALVVVTMLGSGGFLFVYLYRWEWNRALIAGIVFLAAEIGFVGWSLLGRITELERTVERADGRGMVLPASADPARRERISTHLRGARVDGVSGGTRGGSAGPFEWLRADGSRTAVFIPILLGAGLLLSSLAWLVERVARVGAGRVGDERLAGRLSSMGVTPGGFLDPGGDPLSALRGPRPGRSPSVGGSLPVGGAGQGGFGGSVREDG